MAASNDSITFWIPEDETKLSDDIDEFVRTYNYHHGANKTRSGMVRRWARAGLKADQAIEQSDLQIENEREFADFVAQAVREKIRSQSE